MKFTLCREEIKKKVNPMISEYCKLAQKEYKSGQDRERKLIHYELKEIKIWPYD